MPADMLADPGDPAIPAWYSSPTSAYLEPSQVSSYYGITGTGLGQTIAIIDAYNRPSGALHPSKRPKRIRHRVRLASRDVVDQARIRTVIRFRGKIQLAAAIGGSKKRLMSSGPTLRHRRQT